MSETDVYFRLRAETWQHAAIEQGIRPSVRALALESGVPKSTLYRVVRGQQPPNAKTIAALLDTLHVPFEILFERVEPDGHER